MFGTVVKFGENSVTLSSRGRCEERLKRTRSGTRDARALISCLIKRTPKRAASCPGKKPTHCKASKPAAAITRHRRVERRFTSFSSFSSLLLPSIPHSCFVILRLHANKHRGMPHVCILILHVSCHLRDRM